MFSSSRLEPQNVSQDTSQQKPAFVEFKHWDQALTQFLMDMGLTQALRGFENDMLVLNPDWEKERIPVAMATFVRNLVTLNKPNREEPMDAQEEEGMEVDSELDERKLSYVRLANGAKPQTQTSVNKAVSQFIAHNRARNNASNRAEFLHSLDEMRAGAVSSLPNVDTSSWASCARADMKTIDREAQMKYDIAKNEDGPLKRTMKAAETRTSDQLIEKVKSLAAFPAGTEEDVVMSLTPERHPGFDERLSNIEKHLAVRYVPSPPKFFLDRLEFLEDHLVQLERDYPPWAALHFNQPNRGWPPPPRSTPIIVPPYMRAVSSSTTAVPTSAAAGPSTSGSMPHHTSTPGGSEPSQLMGGQRTRSTTSSLQKAVLEKLEVYQAMNDLANGGSSAGAGRSGVSGT